MAEAESAIPPPEAGIGNPDLPIWQVMPQVMETLKNGNRLSLISETGSGKSTQVPQALYAEGFADKGKIFVVENRVDVAAEVARRVAREMHVPLGSKVGYVTGPESRISDDSRIVFMTSGVFKNIIRNDPSLSQASVVLFDEFDERYLLSDIGLALTEKSQGKGGDAKFVLMSATLNAAKISEHFPGIPLIEAAGRPYPVDVHFSDRSVREDEIPREAARIVAAIHETDSPGDVLIFMPGKSEISRTISELKNLNLKGVSVMPLHAELPLAERARVFEPSPERKIIISTNVAERGLTIDGVRYVVDSGQVRMQEYDSERDIAILGTMPCARDSMLQRQGRAGRTAPGEYYSLITRQEYESRPTETRPEILRSPLRSVLLQIKAMGYSAEHDPIRLMDMPGKDQWKAAHQQLRLLGALNPDDEAKLSPFGEDMSELGCDPRDAAMILQGSFLGCGRDMAVIAAIRSANRKLLPTPAGERDAAERQHRKFFVSDTSDLINHLNVYRQAEINGFDSNWCRENFVSFPALREIRQAAGDLMRNAGDLGYDMESRDAGEQTLRQAIATGFPDRVFHYMVGGWYQNLETGQRAKLGRDSVISRAQRIIANDFIRITTKEGEELPLISAATVIT